MGKMTYQGIAASLIFSFFLTNVSPALAVPTMTEEAPEVQVASTDERDMAVEGAVATMTLIDDVMAEVNAAAIADTEPAAVVATDPPAAEEPVEEPAVAATDPPAVEEPIEEPTDPATDAPDDPDEVEDPVEEPTDPGEEEDPDVQAALEALEEAGIIPAGIGEDGAPEYTDEQIELAGLILAAGEDVTETTMQVADILQDGGVAITEDSMGVAMDLVDHGINIDLMPGAFAEAVEAILDDPLTPPMQTAWEVYFNYTGLGDMPWFDFDDIDGCMVCEHHANFTMVVMEALGFNSNLFSIDFTVPGSPYSGHLTVIVDFGDGSFGIYDQDTGQWITTFVVQDGETFEDALDAEMNSETIQDWLNSMGGDEENPITLDGYNIYDSLELNGSNADWTNPAVIIQILQDTLHGDIADIAIDAFGDFVFNYNEGTMFPPVPPPDDDPIEDDDIDICPDPDDLDGDGEPDGFLIGPDPFDIENMIDMLDPKFQMMDPALVTAIV